jgi:hypothetical protein
MFMKCLGQGFHFETYDYTKGKVKKVRRSPTQMRKTLLKWYPHKYLVRPKSLNEEVVKAIKSSKFKINKLIDNPKLDKNMFGNPKIINEVLIQDKVTPLGIKLNDLNRMNEINKGEIIVKKYIDFVLKCWRYGLCDPTYNFSINCGINQKGKIVLVDFDEVTYSKSHIIKNIQDKRWLKAWSYKRGIPKKLKGYYYDKSIENFTIKNLNKYWGTLPT